jgi:polar amino acid transport system substrate-binding protein
MKRTKKVLLGTIIICVLVSLLSCSKDDGNSKVQTIVNKQKQQGNSTKPTQNTNDLRASLGILPGVVEPDGTGPFVDMVKAIDKVYTDGNIKITVCPIERSIKDVVNNEADFSIPMLRNNELDQSKNTFNTATKKMGAVTFIVYSNVNKKITKADIDKAISAGGKFPYQFEGPPGMDSSFNFPYKGSTSPDESIKKLVSGRIDGLVWPQEETDLTIRKLKAKEIYRSKYLDIDDAIVVAKGEHGDKINKIISDCLDKLEKLGKLNEVYKKVHHSYDEWQPSKMGW